MSDALDALISRYLDGTASRDEMRRLDERLRDDPAARRAMVLAAAQDAQLRDLLAAGAAVESGSVARRPRRTVVAVAAAAVVLVAVGVLAFLAGRYPAPQASGSYSVTGGGKVGRGSVIAAGPGGAALSLGGYCRVHVEPGSTLRIEGRKRAEELFLERGAVLCEADSGVGAFVVRSAVGTVSVTGTRFAVRLIDEKGDTDMFGKRMAVRVLAGAVLVSGAWGRMVLHAGEGAAVPPPEAVLRKIVTGLDLPNAEQRKLERMLSARRAGELREAYRGEVRARLFDAARKKLQAAMPKLMPTKVRPKVQAIRTKLRAGPPSATDIALIRMASQKRARKVMMKVIHEAADRLADEAARDDRLIAWLLARNVRVKMAGEKIAAFDAAVKAAGISDREPDYIARAEAAIDSAIERYDPDVTGMVDPKTGAITVSGEELGVPVKDKALEERIAKMLRDALAGLGLPKETMEAVEPMLAGDAVHAERATYCMAVRARLFDAARKKQQALLPQKMPTKVQAKVMAIRTRLKKGGPPTQADRARVQRAAMKRTRQIMMPSLHQTADAVAVRAAKDERLVAASLAKKLRAKLAADKAAALDAALKKAGVAGDEAEYLSQAEERITSIIESYDPDLSGIVDPNTGKVIVND